MTLPFAAIDAIFGRPRDAAAAILFLIEDSSYMVPVWQRLRDSYISPFLTAIKGANPSASVSPFTPALPHLPTASYPPGRGVVDDRFGKRSVQTPVRPLYTPNPTLG